MPIMENVLRDITERYEFMKTENAPDQVAAEALPVLVLLGVVLVILAFLLANNTRRVERTAEATAEPTEAVVSAPTAELGHVMSTPVPAGGAVAEGYPAQAVQDGRALYLTSCSACHGPDARGIIGIGKDLIDSEFVHGLTDEELREFVNVGRGLNDPLNTTGMVMPAKGVNPTLTDPDIDKIIAFIRTTADPSLLIADEAVAAAPDGEATQPETEPLPPFQPLDVSGLPLSSDAPRRTSTEFNAEFAYLWSCSGCHGASGEGVEGIGPSLLESPMVTDEDTSALFDFIVQGNPMVNPEEGFPHPVRGEYPILTDEQIQALIDHIHTLEPVTEGPESIAQAG